MGSLAKAWPFIDAGLQEAGGIASGNPLMMAGGGAELGGAFAGDNKVGSMLTGLGSDLSWGIPGLFDPSQMGFKGASQYLPQKVQDALGIGSSSNDSSGTSNDPGKGVAKGKGIAGIARPMLAAATPLILGLTGAGTRPQSAAPMAPAPAQPQPVPMPSSPASAAIANSGANIKPASPMSALAAYRQFLNNA